MNGGAPFPDAFGAGDLACRGMPEALPCQRVFAARDGLTQCGLLHGHDGDHVPCPVGECLHPLPLLHPLDVYLTPTLRRCPAGCAARSAEYEPTLWVRS